MKTFAKNSKKALAAFLAVLMMFSCMAVAVNAEDPLVLTVSLEKDSTAKTITAEVTAPDGYTIDTSSLDYVITPATGDQSVKSDNSCLFYNLEYGKYTVVVTGTVEKSNGAIQKTAVGSNDIVLDKNAVDAPTGLMVTAITDSSIEVTKIDGAIYSLNNGTYGTSNKFEDLENGKTYTISAKFAETDTTKESDPVTCKATLDTKVQTAACDNGIAYAITNNTKKSITIYPVNQKANSVTSIKSITVTKKNFESEDAADETCTAPSNIQSDGSWLYYNLEYDNVYTFTVTTSTVTTIKNDDGTESKGEPVECTGTITLPLYDLSRTEPANFKVNSGTSTSVVVTSYTNAEYTDDNWTTINETGNVFTGLNPGQTYTIKARYKATDTAPCSYDAVLTYKALNSKAAPKDGDVKLESSTATTATLTYVEGMEYSILNGTPWQPSNTFTGLEAGVEYTAQVRYKETDTTRASEAIQVKFTPKAVQEAPANFAVTDVTDKSITVTAYATGDVEYSIDGWKTTNKVKSNGVEKDSNVFDNLSQNATYTISARYKETSTKQAGKEATVTATPSALTVVLTPSSATGKMYVKINYDNENNTISGFTFVNTKTGASEGSFTDGTKDLTASTLDDIAKDGKCEFAVTGLTIGETYKATVTITNANKVESTKSETKTLEKADCTKKPEDFRVLSVTGDSVTLTCKDTDGVEYSSNGTDFSSKNEFKGLTAGTSYQYWARYAETTATKAGTIVGPITAVPKAETATPVLALESRDTSTVTLKAIDGAQYLRVNTYIENKEVKHVSIPNDAKWQSSNKFTGLEDGTVYDFYARIPETSTSQASAVSEVLSVTTLKKADTATVKDVVVENVSINMIKVKEQAGYEYICYIDGRESDYTWQDSNVFNNLSQETTYCIKQRVKVDTDVQEQGASSAVKKVKTNSKAPNIIDESSLETFTLKTDNGSFTITAKSVKKSTSDHQWGDIQFIPTKYTVKYNNETVREGKFSSSDGITYTASNQVGNPGDYTVIVTYEMQKYTGEGDTGFVVAATPTQQKTFTVVSAWQYNLSKVLTFFGKTMPSYIMKFFNWLRDHWSSIMDVVNILLGSSSTAA